MVEPWVIGKRMPRVDAHKKVTGEASYCDDIALPGMLYGKIFRSPHPHARISHIEVKRAVALPGVRAVMTGADVPDERAGLSIKDQPILARDKVRYIGEPVAAVAAVDPDTAEEALNLIEVEYEPLPAVFDPEEAIQPGVAVIHEGLAGYEATFQPTEEGMRGNVCYHGRICQGDVERGFLESDLVCEDVFKTQKVHQSYLEPHSALASFDPSGRVTVWTSTQRPHSNQAIIASLLRMPMNRIRVIGCTTGGGFGGKNRTLIEPICVALAQRAGRPVKLALTREEELSATTTRHPCMIKIKTGVKRDGQLVARQVTLLYDSGAYSPATNAVWLGIVCASGPYRIPHVRIDGYAVYTNKMMSAAFRGFGAPQGTFAFESQMDMIAERLGMDPIEIRLKNAVETGDRLPLGLAVPSSNLKAALKAVAKRADEYKRNVGNHRGLGVACGGFVCGGFVSSAYIRFNEDGTVVAATGAMDMGQGLATAITQIVAEELGILPEDVTVISGDTDATPFDIGIFGDRGTNTAGMAAKLAAEDAKGQLLARAAARLEVSPQDLEVKHGEVFVKGSPHRSLKIVELLKGNQYVKEGQILGQCSFAPPQPFPDPSVAAAPITPLFRTLTFNAQLAEVEVDPHTGTVKVLRLVSAQDCGRALNPLAVEGQMEGGAAIGLGYALSEDMIIENGKVLNPSFLDYKIFLATDVPEVEAIVLDGHDPTGPFGAKGVGNTSLIPTAAAIANAIYHATGVRIKELPITPEKILRALEERRLQSIPKSRRARPRASS